MDLSIVDRAVAKHGRGADAAVPILHELQTHYHYLPREAMKRVCELTEITPAGLSGVATFYDRFRLTPAGEHMIRVCNGTACHVKGAPQVEQAIRRALHIADDADTDEQGHYTVERVACLGCCTLAPAVQIDEVTYGHQNSDRVIEMLSDFERRLRRGGSAGSGQGFDELGNGRSGLVGATVDGDASAPERELRIGMGSCCVAKGSDQVLAAAAEAAKRHGVVVSLKRVGCVGMCHRTPLIELVERGEPVGMYAEITADQVDAIVDRHFARRGFAQTARRAWRGFTDLLTGFADEPSANGGPLEQYALEHRDPHVTAFLSPQQHIATEGFGEVDPTDMDDYLRRDGFAGLRRCLDQLDPEQVIEEVDESGLRGRGGAGFPTARKWRAVREAAGDIKYVIANGDEGDPGAFMDRMLLESFPYRVLEGMAIAAYATGATRGFLYIRAEYPLAVKRVREAIDIARQFGWLGEQIAGSELSFDVEVREGGGAFVCGEETALIASMEGERGEPRLRPPFPAESGLWGKPTLVNNVETLCNLPWLLRNGAESFASIGSAHSKGTKVFALAGKVKRGGLIEVPMGVTIRQVVDDIGGGVADGRRLKAVQIGGPSGGCIPAHLADTHIDFDALQQVGAIMGSGGLIVLDDSDCMVDVARYFLQFTQDQSCGHCTPCRVGTRRMLEIMDRLVDGRAKPRDLEELEKLCHDISSTSLCGLGRTAPNPVLTTLKYFRDEYQAHLEGRCPAGRCKGLVRYSVTQECIGCTICARKCPTDAIEFKPYLKHDIDDDLCIRCDICRTACPEDAIVIESTGASVNVP